MTKRYSLLFWTVARISVGLIFVYAGLTKLLEPAANFEAVLLKYGVFAPPWIPLLARAVPWLEWILGAFLIVGYAPRLTASSSSLLCLAFLVTLGGSRLLLTSGNADCGCFGQGGLLHLTVRQIFLVDLLSLGILLQVAGLKEYPWTIHGLLTK